MRNNRQMIKLVEVAHNRYSDQFHLNEIIVNSAHIVSIRSDQETAGIHAKGLLPEGLHEAQQFSRLPLPMVKKLLPLEPLK